MNKQEILEEINKTKEYLADLEKEIKRMRIREEETKAEAEKILVRRMLEDIARRLNKGKEIDWTSEAPRKYHLCIDKYDNIYDNVCYSTKFEGTVYCLDESFLGVAIQEIGEERLKKYLRGE